MSFFSRVYVIYLENMVLTVVSCTEVCFHPQRQYWSVNLLSIKEEKEITFDKFLMKEDFRFRIFTSNHLILTVLTEQELCLKYLIN